MALELGNQSILVGDSVFAAKVGQAACKFALEVINESDTAPNHQARKAMANTILINFALVQTAFARAVATRMTGTDPSDADINGSVRAVWNQLSLAMFPAGE